MVMFFYYVMSIPESHLYNFAFGGVIDGVREEVGEKVGVFFVFERFQTIRDILGGCVDERQLHNYIASPFIQMFVSREMAQLIKKMD